MNSALRLLICGGTVTVLGIISGCGSRDRDSTADPRKPAWSLNGGEVFDDQDDLARYQQIADRLGSVVLERPTDLDPLSYKKNIAYFRLDPLPESSGDMPPVPRTMTEAEGRKFFFDGFLVLVETANSPSPSSSDFENAIKEGLVVNPPCATTNSQVLKNAAKKAGLQWVADLFANPHNYYPTHNNEIELQRLGWSYYMKPEWVAPPASVGMWDRYNFYGTPGHSGHIFVIFKDMGLGGNDLVGDNTRRAGEPHGHPYRGQGEVVGFWLPPGVYPKHRAN